MSTPRDLAILGRRRVLDKLRGLPVEECCWSRLRSGVDEALSALDAITRSLCEVCGARPVTIRSRCGACSAATAVAPICGVRPEIRVLTGGATVAQADPQEEEGHDA